MGNSLVHLGVDRDSGGISKLYPPATMFRRVPGPMIMAALTGATWKALFLQSLFTHVTSRNRVGHLDIQTHARRELVCHVRRRFRAASDGIVDAN